MYPESDCGRLVKVSDELGKPLVHESLVLEQVGVAGEDLIDSIGQPKAGSANSGHNCCRWVICHLGTPFLEVPIRLVIRERRQREVHEQVTRDQLRMINQPNRHDRQLTRIGTDRHRWRRR